MNREAAIQKPCHGLMVQYAPPECLYFSIPNEGKRKNGAFLVAMGLVSGVADYLIYWNNCLIFIEFKCEKDVHGRKTYQKKEQKEFQARVEAIPGVYYFVIRSTAEFIGTLHGFGLLQKVRAF